MNLKKIFTKKVTGSFAVICFIIIATMGIYWMHILNVAHSSFENYYNFRGCTELIGKTDTYGVCQISSGKTIKIVKYEDKWYLDGDLPYGAKVSITDYKDATYTIEGQQVTLIGGYSEVPVMPGSASKTITRYFGNDAIGDLNGDGVPDVAFILSQTSGGSGTFYYVVVALKNGYQGTNAILLGDRIAPQTTEIKNGEVIVNYADRKPTDPMTTQPSVGVSKYLKVQGTSLMEVQ